VGRGHKSRWELCLVSSDTFGNVILEAQACGLPVVVSDSGGPKELVEDKGNGLITKSHDVEDFAHAIRALVMDPALRDRMGRSARKQRNRPKLAKRLWQILGRDRNLKKRCSHSPVGRLSTAKTRDGTGRRQVATSFANSLRALRL